MENEVKHHHPSLEEILNDRSLYEWLPINVSGFFVGTFTDAENEKGDISSSNFNLFSSASESENGTYSFNSATIAIELVEAHLIDNLEGKSPLGSYNCHDPEAVHISIKLKPEIRNNLLLLLAHNYKNLEVKVAIPKWEDPDAKCLPLLKYQVMYKQKDEI